MSLGTGGPQCPQVGCDLLGTPLQGELGLDLGLQLRVRGELDTPWPSVAFEGAVMGEVGVVVAVVVRQGGAAQFAADRRRCPAESYSYFPDAQAAFAQGGDPFALQRRQVAARARSLGQ